MAGGTPNNDGQQQANLQLAINEIRRLQAEVAEIQKEKAEEIAKTEEEENIEVSQPLAQQLWDAQVPPNFKIPQLPSFDGKSDPLEHLMAVGTQTAILGAEEHLKCKLLSSTFKDAVVRWYMNLPKNSITGYQDFHRKLIHQFSVSKHIQVTATNMFSLRQKSSETLREYLARFSEATIKVSNPNQEMFVAAFHNGLRAGHFNESLAQKPAETMQEVMKRAECYIKGEESNTEKRSRDHKERAPESGGNRYPDYQRRRWPNKDHRAQRSNGGSYYPQKRASKLSKNMHHSTEPEGHDTEKCFRLKDLIEELIRSGHLKKFIERAAHENKARQRSPRSPRNPPTKDARETIRGDQILARQCYESSLKIKKIEISRLSVNNTNTHEAAELDPREDFQDRRVSPIEELEEIQIGKEQHQTTSIGTAMGEEERKGCSRHPKRKRGPLRLKAKRHARDRRNRNHPQTSYCKQRQTSGAEKKEARRRKKSSSRRGSGEIDEGPVHRGNQIPGVAR
ncbi:hypothetical protein P8452_70580 [Trifolium repens]|nr:hypothetical protein P8452_70580 [Trifolium repens]